MDDIMRKEFMLRLTATLLLVLTASLVGFDSQTKLLFYTVHIKANFKYLDALCVLVWIDVAVAGYNVLQLLRCLFINRSQSNISYKNYWFFFFLDQAAVYSVFAANSAAIEASTIALVGIKSLQWMKICNRFTRFCIQIGGALLLGYVAILVLILLSSLTAFQLFRHYSPNHFLKLKTKLNNNNDNFYFVHQNMLQNDLETNPSSQHFI